MDIRSRVYAVLNDQITDDPASLNPARIGAAVADDLESVLGVVVDGQQVAEYITVIPDWKLASTAELADALAEAIEEDLEEEA